jgi:hypothetical protein
MSLDEWRDLEQQLERTVRVPLARPQPAGSVYCGLSAGLCRNLLGWIE